MGTKGKWSITWEEKTSFTNSKAISKRAFFDSEEKRDSFVDNVLRKLPNFLWTTAKGFHPDNKN